MKIEVAKALLELREQFTKDIVQGEKNGDAHYTEHDFDSFEQFIKWLNKNYGE